MTPEWLEALVLGIVQGLTEFVPVSSSGHLVLVPYLAGWDKPSLAFDVMLHVGTLGALLVYFRAEIAAIVRGLLRLDTSPEGDAHRRIGLMIVPASVPIGVGGLLLEERIEAIAGSPVAVSVLLLVTAGLLLLLERTRDRRIAAAGEPVAGADHTQPAAAPRWDGDWRSAARRSDVVAAPAPRLPTGRDSADPLGADLTGLTLRAAMVTGLFQCLALLPGISRSGATITGGVLSGMTREAAARFSFLLVIPALVGATVLSLGDLGEGGETAAEYAIGMLAAFGAGYVAVRFLVGLVSRERLTGFAWYCVAAAAVGLIGYAFLGPPSTV